MPSYTYTPEQLEPCIRCGNPRWFHGGSFGAYGGRYPRPGAGDPGCSGFRAAATTTTTDKGGTTMDHNQKPGAPAQMPYTPPALKEISPSAAAAAITKAVALKPGYQTSEFWLSSLVACLPAVTPTVPGWVSAAVAAAYALSRALAKFHK